MTDTGPTDGKSSPPVSGASASWRGPFSGVESRTAWIVAASAAALLTLVNLTGLVIDGDTHALDRRILLALRSDAAGADLIGPKWLEAYVRDVTALGGFAILSLLVLGISGFLAVTGRRGLALRIFAVSLSGWLLMHAVKFAIQRPRPDLVPHGVEVYASSFPSGHAMTSAVVYLTLGAALARTTEDARAKTFVLTFAATLIVMIGASRVYLGVHWPSDVLGGWMLGAAWAGLSWFAFSWLDRTALRRSG